MGYTHYWSQPALDVVAISDIGDTIAKCIKEVSGKVTDTAGGYAKDPVKICGGDGTGKPKLGETEIVFNGNGPDLDHETFYIGRDPDRQFCKTARKPYDVVVVAALAYCAARHGFEVSSDGDAEEWQAGVDLVNKVVGEPIPNPLIVAELVGAA